MKRRWMQDALYIILAFTFCFMFQVQQIFVANFLFVLLVLFQVKKIGINKISLISFLIYMVVVIASTLVYKGDVPFGSRNVFQLLFNVHYLFLLVNLDFNNKKLERYIHLFSVLLSVWIIAAYLLSGAVFEYSLAQILVIGRAWGKGLVCGWPNETVLPLLYGLFLNLFVMKQSRKRTVILTAIICVALLLTTSRSAFLGAAVLVAYYVFKCIFALPAKQKKTAFGIIGACVLVAAVFVLTNTGLRTRLFFMADRQVNVVVALDYLKDRPLLGYGGNTLDVLHVYDPSPLTDRNLMHTHNTVLELLVRYGILGLVSFLLILWCSVRKIRNLDGICALVLFWGLSMFQIYFRNFIFLMIIILLIKRYTPVDRDPDLQIDLCRIRCAVCNKIGKKKLDDA